MTRYNKEKIDHLRERLTIFKLENKHSYDDLSVLFKCALGTLLHFVNNKKIPREVNLYHIEKVLDALEKNKKE